MIDAYSFWFGASVGALGAWLAAGYFLIVRARPKKDFGEVRVNVR